MNAASMMRRIWLLGLAGVLLWPVAVRAQSNIYWTQTPGGQAQVWSVKPDGTGNVNVFPAGLIPPAPFVMGTDVAGPTLGTYPLDPANPTSPKAQWFVTAVTTDTGDATEVFAFAPDGNGGAVWRQLTDSSASVSKVTGGVKLTPGDEFVTLLVGDPEVDAYGRTSYPSRKVVRLANPLTLSSPARPDDLQVAYQVLAPDRIVQQSPNSDGTRTVARVDHLYPDGNTRSQLRLYVLGGVADTLLVDPVATNLSPESPSWSPDGASVAFDNGRWGSELGIYTVNPTTGAIQSVVLISKSKGNYNEPLTPIWAPDSKSVALWMIYSYFAINNYTGSAVGTYPVPGTKRDKVTIVSPALPWANRAIPFGWR